MLIDDIPEYREMRKGLMALRLEVPAIIADNLLSRCERAALTVYNTGYVEGWNDRAGRESD